MRRTLVVLVAGAIYMTGCSLFVSLDGLQGAGDDGGSQATSDASTDAIAQDGSRADASSGDAGTGADGAVNLIANGSFDDGAGGCGAGWTTYGASFVRSSVAHGGGSSCELCPLASGETSYAIMPTNGQNVSGGSYYIEAWIMAPPDAGAAGATGVQAFITYADGGQDYFQGTQVTPGSSWAISNEGFTFNDDGQLTIQVHCFFPQNGCVLVDDVAVYAQ